MKCAARNTKAEASIDILNAKIVQIEKTKGKIMVEINDMTASLDQAQVINAAMERKAISFDKIITEMTLMSVKKKLEMLHLNFSKSS